MNQENGMYCAHCHCDLQWIAQYGNNVQRCPECGSLWANGCGLQALIHGMHHKKIDPSQMCCEFGAKPAVAEKKHTH